MGINPFIIIIANSEKSEDFIIFLMHKSEK